MFSHRPASSLGTNFLGKACVKRNLVLTGSHLTLALLACAASTCAQTLLFQDGFSDPKLTGWTTMGSGGLRTNINQQLLISATCGPFRANNLFANHFILGHRIGTPVTLTNNWTVEGRVDLVGANQNDAWSSMHFLWPSVRGGSGYLLWKDEDEIALVKFWNGGGSTMAWFFYEQLPLKNTNVTLMLTLSRRDSNLVVNSRVLDKANANAILFDRTVIDTPQADSVITNRTVRGAPAVQDLAEEAWRLISGSGYVEATLDWVNAEHGPDGAAEVIYDNVEVWFYEVEPLLASLTLQPPNAILNWTGGVPPFQVQTASGLPTANWMDLVTNALSPLTITLDRSVGFYQILGH